MPTTLRPTALRAPLGLRLSAFVTQCKPRVNSLIVFTAMIGMFLAVPGWPPLDVLSDDAALSAHDVTEPRVDTGQLGDLLEGYLRQRAVRVHVGPELDAVIEQRGLVGSEVLKGQVAVVARRV